MNRRKFLAFFGLAASVPVVAKLPDTLPAVEGVRLVHKSDPIVQTAIQNQLDTWRAEHQKASADYLNSVLNETTEKYLLKALREQNHRTFLARKSTYWM